jgi:O-antigen ligase
LLIPFTFLLTLKHLRHNNILGPITVLKQNAAVLVPFSIVALSALVLSALPGAFWDEGAKWILLIPYGVCITSAAAIMGRFSTTSSAVKLAALGSLLALATSVWYDTAHPGTFAPIINRPAGFSGNANFSSLVAVVVCAGAINLGSNKYRHMPKAAYSSAVFNLILILLTFSIVCMTMSRSGLVVFLVLMGLAIYYRFFRSGLSRSRLAAEVVTTCLAAVIALGFAVIFAQLSSSTQGKSRLTRLLNNQQVDDGSTGTRLNAVVEGIELIEDAPLLGHGTGFSRTMSELPHNIYLQQWINNGAVGLLTYLGFLLCAVITFQKRGCRNGVALIIVAAVGGIFSHNILDQRPFLLMLGVLLGGSRGS